MNIRRDPYAAMRYGDFRLFVAGKFLLTVALQIQAIVASWIIYQQTKDPFALGLIGLTEAVPALALALPGGFLADRRDRRLLMLASTGVMLGTSVFMAKFAFALEPGGSIWPFFLIIFLTGLARGFYNPAQSAFWGQLLPKEEYVNGSVWNSSLWQIGAVTGPAAGGLFYAWLGAGWTSIIICILMLTVMSLYLAINKRPVPAFNPAESALQSVRSGLRFFFGNRLLLSAVSLDLFAVLFGGAVALLPAFADQVLHTGPEGLGLLRSAPAIGAVAMAILLAYRPPAGNAGRLMLWCVAGFGACMIVFALSKSFLLSLAVLIMSGMLDNVSVVIRSTILQSHTPDEMRGRVSAVNSIFVGSSNEIGAFESGVAARLMGLVNSVVFGGCMTLLVTAITARVAPELRKLRL